MADLDDIQYQHRTEFIEPMGWAGQRTPLEAVALIASEVGELANELRVEHPDNYKVGHEMADIILRVTDLAEDLGIVLSRAVVSKMNHNIATIEEKRKQGRIK